MNFSIPSSKIDQNCIKKQHYSKKLHNFKNNNNNFTKLPPLVKIFPKEAKNMIIWPEKAPNSQFCRLWTRGGVANPWPQCNPAEIQTEKEKIACKLRQRQNKSTLNSEYQRESPSRETTKIAPAPIRRTCPWSGHRRGCQWRCSRSEAGSQTWRCKRNGGGARTDQRWRPGRNWGRWWGVAQ